MDLADEFQPCVFSLMSISNVLSWCDVWTDAFLSKLKGEDRYWFTHMQRSITIASSSWKKYLWVGRYWMRSYGWRGSICSLKHDSDGTTESQLHGFMLQHLSHLSSFSFLSKKLETLKQDGLHCVCLGLSCHQHLNWIYNRCKPSFLS